MSDKTYYDYIDSGPQNTDPSQDYAQYAIPDPQTSNTSPRHSRGNDESKHIKNTTKDQSTKPSRGHSRRALTILAVLSFLSLSLNAALFGLHFYHRFEWQTDLQENGDKFNDLSSDLEKSVQDTSRLEGRLNDVEKPGSITNPAASCDEIKRQDNSSEDGPYFLRDLEGTIFEVYCDMNTAGGGWTLVASVHENNIDGKCTPGDRWSSEQGSSSSHPHGDGFWKNRAIHGRANSAACDDYKNPGYFGLKAKNMMIWHVPNDTPMTQFGERAFLRYHTETDFLQSYGGNLAFFFYANYTLRSSEYEANGLDDGPVVPVVWDTGDGNELLSMYTGDILADGVIVPEYIHFRVIHSETLVYALCPGVKIETQSRAYIYDLCIGTTSEDTNKCGDYTYRDGFVTPKLIESVVMIFYLISC